MAGRMRLIVETFNGTRHPWGGAVHGLFWLSQFPRRVRELPNAFDNPLASLYAAIPVSGAVIALFTVEQLVNGWRNGFAGQDAASAIERYRPEAPPST